MESESETQNDFFKLIENFNKTLNADIDEFNTLSSPEDKSKKLLDIVSKFNHYLDEININNKSIHVKKLLQHFFDMKKDKKLNYTIIINISNNIFKNSITLSDFIDNLDNNIIIANSTIIYYFAYSIYKSTLIAYSYDYYIRYINSCISGIPRNRDMSDEPLNDADINGLITKIMDTCVYYPPTNDVIDYSHCINKDTHCIDLTDLSTIYSNIIKQFNIDHLNANDNVITISINEINNYQEKMIETLKANDSDINVDELIKNRLDSYKTQNSHINYLLLKNYLLVKKISLSNNYVTIPQYIGICWFVSILTGMCYSDANRKLIETKIDNLKTKSTSDADKNFINTIIYIIENITSKQLKYGEDINTKCDMLKFFKNKLPEFLTLKQTEIAEKFTKPEPFNLQDYIGNNDYYFISRIGESPISAGITLYGYFILNTLYNILDISSLFFIKIDSIIYEKTQQETEQKRKPNPDVIIIQTISNSYDKEIKDKITTSPLFKNKTDNNLSELNDIVTYNGSKYKLDYILFLNTGINKICNRAGCGHCISAIHYHGDKYYYDSAHYEKKHICPINPDGSGKEEIGIPCTLIRQDWNMGANFSINKCFYREVDIFKDALKIEKYNDDEILMTFDFNDIVCVYVKINDEDSTITGGKNNYKSTHKKINIMNKNKNIIERTIYIDSNKNKFIKFNKIFEPLSNFKYNKKNKYYYIK